MYNNRFFSSLFSKLISAIVCDKDKKEDEDENKAPSPLDYLTNPKLAAAIEAANKLKALIHSSSSSHIQKREKTSGFEFLDISANAQRSRGLPKAALKWIFNRSVKPFADKSNRKEIREVVEVFEKFLEWEIEDNTQQFFGIVSKKGDGKVNAIFLHFKKREDGKFNFKKVFFKGSFRLAADLVITRSSKKNFFSSSSRDIIRYLPRRGITGQDIRDLLNLIVPKIANVINEFVPADA